MEYTAKLDFKLGTDEWEEFVERMDLYFEANEIEREEKKRAIFLTKVDAETYSIIRRVCAPKKPKETELKEIITKMEYYLKLKVNETVLRQRFRERKQKKEESVTQYIASLRNLARECKFKEEEEALRDQLVTGVKNKAIKIALFKMEKLTLDEAVKTATAIEGANTAVDTLEPSTTEAGNGEREEENDNKTYQIQTRGRYGGERRTRPNASHTSQCFGKRKGQHNMTQRLCDCCGKPNNNKRDCWHKNRTCDKCGKTGHLRAGCKATKASESRRNVKNVEAESETSGTESDAVSETELL